MYDILHVLRSCSNMFKFSNVQRSEIKITSGSNKETGHMCINCTDIEV